MTKRFLSKKKYFTLFIFFLAATIIMSLFGAESDKLSQVIAGRFWIPWVLFNVTALVFIYRMWQAIQDDKVPRGPLKAVGLLLIPLFNLYWVFPVFFGYARAFNAYLVRHDVDTHDLHTDLFLAFPLLTVAIPVLVALGSLLIHFNTAVVLGDIFLILGVICVVLLLVVFFVIVSKVCDGVNAIYRQTSR